MARKYLPLSAPPPPPPTFPRPAIAGTFLFFLTNPPRRRTRGLHLSASLAHPRPSPPAVHRGIPVRATNPAPALADARDFHSWIPGCGYARRVVAHSKEEPR